MALINAHLHLADPSIATGLSLILPDKPRFLDEQGRCPLLWLPADEGQQYDGWIRFTNVERMARQYGIAVAMPQGWHSNYADMKNGPRWFTYLSKTLPEYLQQQFPVTFKAEHTYAFGYGMGALGILRWAAQSPGSFRMIGLANSDLTMFITPDEKRTKQQKSWLETIYGVKAGQLVAPQDDPLRQLDNLLKSPQPLMLLSSPQASSMEAWRKLLRPGDCRWHSFPDKEDEWDTREAMLSYFMEHAFRA